MSCSVAGRRIQEEAGDERAIGRETGRGRQSKRRKLQQNLAPICGIDAAEKAARQDGWQRENQ
jgi:hypothetical protein